MPLCSSALRDFAAAPTTKKLDIVRVARFPRQ
jgi:hypothetical protein